MRRFLRWQFQVQRNPGRDMGLFPKPYGIRKQQVPPVRRLGKGTTRAIIRPLIGDAGNHIMRVHFLKQFPAECVPVAVMGKFHNITVLRNRSVFPKAQVDISRQQDPMDTIAQQRDDAQVVNQPIQSLQRLAGGLGVRCV